MAYDDGFGGSSRVEEAHARKPVQVLHVGLKVL